MPANLSELRDALEFVSGSDVGEQRAYVCVRTGKTFWHFDPMISGDLDEELPEDIEDEEKYLPVPDKRALDLGRPLAFNFVREFLPEDFDDVRDMFGRRGAYRRFRQLLISRRVLDQWYTFEQQATERALREWCKLNSIAVAD